MEAPRGSGPTPPSIPLGSRLKWQRSTKGCLSSNAPGSSVFRASFPSPAPSRSLLEVVESRHQEKLLQEEFRVQHGDVSCPANESVGSVGQRVEHVVSDQRAALGFDQGAEKVVDHFGVDGPCEEGRRIGAIKRQSLCVCWVPYSWEEPLKCPAGPEPDFVNGLCSLNHTNAMRLTRVSVFEGSSAHFDPG